MAGKLPPNQEVAKRTLEQQLAAARKALQRAEDQKATAEKKLADLKTQVAKLEADVKAAAKPAETTAKPTPAVTPAPSRPKDDGNAVDIERVLDLMKQRLHLMKDVAGAKWQTKQTDPDAKRETELLDQLVRQGEKLGLSADVVRTFFVAQFDAAKQVQQSFFDRFQKEKAELKNVPDLQKDLRPKLDQVSQSLLTELGKLQPHLANPAVQQRLRDRAAAMLTGEGITDAVRNRALEPLVKK
jgi:chorismate mutase-like protein